MEPAKIDWESLESVFVMDRVYEDINAPQWVDFFAPDSPSHLDDVAWFCRPDCKHPRTADDFLKSTPPSFKLLRSVSRIAEWTRREANLKRRGQGQSSIEDSENQNPNFATPNHQIKHLNNKNNNIKAAIKSSGGKEDDEYSEILLHSDDNNKPRLKATQSARDLFGGRDLFGKITDFCNELKKMASRAKEREEEEQQAAAAAAAQKSNSNIQYKPLGLKEKQNVEGSKNVLGERERDRERKPLLEVKPRKNKIKRADNDDAENIPVSLDLNAVKRKEEHKLLPIRTNPPTPQGFSATRDPANATPPKGPKSRLMDREILEEVGQSKTLREELNGKSHTKSASPNSGRTLDVFWFLKPCTLSS